MKRHKKKYLMQITRTAAAVLIFVIQLTLLIYTLGA